MFLVGTGCSCAFSIVGIRSVYKDESLRLEKQTNEIAQAVQTTWEDYEMVALWIHQSLRTKTNFSSFAEDRRDFEILYEYVESIGVHAQALAYMPNITHDWRAGLEAESRAYYAKEYPEIPYYGFTGVEYAPDLPPVPTLPEGYAFTVRSERPWYFPSILLQPVTRNVTYLDFDMLSYNQVFIKEPFSQKVPLLSLPIPDFIDPGEGKKIILMHPGVEIQHDHDNDHNHATPVPEQKGMASVLINARSFFDRVALSQSDPATVFIYDPCSGKGVPPILFGGARWLLQDNDTHVKSELIRFGRGMSNKEISWDELETKVRPNRLEYRDIDIAEQRWRIVVVADADHHQDTPIAFAAIGGALMLLATQALVIWYLGHTNRDAQWQDFLTRGTYERG
jgi:hypothetical protein